MDKKAPIIIEAAMVSEMTHILGVMENVTERELCGYPVFEGSIDSYPVVLVRNKVGMINAALATKAAIDEYKPLCLISEGTAGAYDSSVHTGDIILGEKICNINSVHMRTEDCAKLKVITDGEWKSELSFSSSGTLMQAAGRVEYSHGRVLRGAIGSADFWSFSAEGIELIRKRYGTVCEDMESFAVAQTCTQMMTPFLCVRVISNNEPAGEAFDERAAEYAQRFTEDAVRAIAGREE